MNSIIMARNNVPQSVWENPIHFITFGFGSGAMPYAPGTFGTLASIPFFYLVQNWSWPWYGILTILLALVSMVLCGRTCRELGVHDHPGTVLDELVGFFVTMSFAPDNLWHGWYVVFAFLLFRLFDITKPYPIKWLDQNVPGGFGVVLDDIVAGIYAFLILQIIIYLID